MHRANMNMGVKCSCTRGVLLEVTFWMFFSVGITTCRPIQTLNEILRSVENEDSMLRADLESIYAFTHKSWSPHNEVPTELDRMSRDPRLYVMETELEETEQASSNTTTKESGHKKDVDPWSLIWYMASFGGLVAFFLVVSCSECCCSKRTSTSTSSASARPVEPPPEVTQWVDETPPPPYHLFAPPSYDTLFYGNVQTDEKNKCEVYVVPIHNHVVSLQSTTSASMTTSA